ncbi:complement C1q-like protein 4 [Megalops cyprinoides]|uniref:complement C1q-like protein 4 n=1 Tax=Megalops cyprinoides TaxID=118141 RepID=UPI001865477A|nr:complement C1q-like protein 4 [Megalops cyprinoides]
MIYGLQLPVFCVLIASVGGQDSHGAGVVEGSCRLVCDPLPSLASGHALGVHGLVIPLSSKGSKGIPGIAGPPGKAGPPGPPGPRGQASSTRSPVAFYVALKEEFSTDEILKFTDVVTNLGQAYEPSSGKFTCPTTGVYFFSFHIVKTGRRLWADLMVNKEVVASATALDVMHTDTAANSAVLKLKTGDQVYVKLDGSDKTLQDTNNRYSTFSGYLVNEN